VPPADLPYPVESIQFPTRDGEALAGWLLPAEGSKKAVVLLHGYGGTRKQMLRRACFLRAHGFTALLYDARACGESTGDRITFGFREREDVIAAVKILKDRGHTEIACLGVSQGGATILFAADELADVKCIICESVYDEMAHAVDRRMRRYTGVPGWLGGCIMVPCAEQRLGVAIGEVKPRDYIAKLRCPVFIISGECDDRTLPEDTQRLFDAAHGPKSVRKK
jgi:dipeptidyl aminopeptidase/acylaminoacyl peptidase